MGKELVKVKNNKKSEVYENDDYVVKVSDIDGFFYKKNGSSNVPYDYDKEDGEYMMVEAVRLEITNKGTGKKSQKRCYQGYNVIEDVRDDLNGSKSRFRDMFSKID